MSFQMGSTKKHTKHRKITVKYENTKIPLNQVQS